MDNIKKVQSIQFAVPKNKNKNKKPDQKKPKQQKTYSVLYYADLINLLINYQIPVAQQTLDKLKSNTVYLIPREVEIIKR